MPAPVGRTTNPTPSRPVPTERRIAVTKDTPSKAELSALAASDKPTADCIARAQRGLVDLINAGGKVVVTTPKGNGYKPVVTVVPPGFDASKPAKVQTHYHGDSTAAAAQDGQATKSMKELMRQDPQRVFVLPEARGNVGASKTDWTNVTSQAQTTREALEAAGVGQVGERTVSVHSAGGRALAAALRAPDGLEADRVVLLDCLYEPAMSKIRDGLLARKDAVKEFVVVRGTNEADRAVAMNAALAPKSRLELMTPTGGENAHDACTRWFLDGRTKLSPGGWRPS